MKSVAVVSLGAAFALIGLGAVFVVVLEGRLSAMEAPLFHLNGLAATSAERTDALTDAVRALTKTLGTADARIDETLTGRIDRTIERIGVLSDQQLEFAAALAAITTQLNGLAASLARPDERSALPPLPQFYAQHPASASLKEAAARNRLAANCLGRHVPALIGNTAPTIVPSVRCRFLREAPADSFEFLRREAQERMTIAPSPSRP